ncbi:MAG: hypothetical protein EA405_04055 [Rhodospirillales bacterium]|nr:MAG: hypothetical protein EA405_04055 [Rhodospirillales bacterium]
MQWKQSRQATARWPAKNADYATAIRQVNAADRPFAVIAMALRWRLGGCQATLRADRVRAPLHEWLRDGCGMAVWLEKRLGERFLTAVRRLARVVTRVITRMRVQP